jgi:hypothetical protein
MNDPSNVPATRLSTEEGVAVLLSNVRHDLCRNYQKCEDRIRKSPATAVVGAAAVGYLLHRMPVRSILVTQVRVLSALTPPALFLFGAAKLYEFLQRQELAKRS